MRISWKATEDYHEAQAGDKIYRLKKSTGGSVWELFQVIAEGTHGFPVSMTQHYLTNAKSLAAAKKIASELHNGKIYLDENCVPRKAEQPKDV